MPNQSLSQFNQPLEAAFLQWIPEMPASPCLLCSYYKDPVLWQSMTKDQRKTAKDQLHAEQAHQSQTTSPSPCKQMTSPRTSTSLNGLPTTQSTQSLDQLPKDHKSQPANPSLPVVQVTPAPLNNVTPILQVHGHQTIHLSAPKVSHAQSKAHMTPKWQRQRQAEDVAQILLILLKELLPRHRSPLGILPVRLMTRPVTPPRQGDSPVKLPDELPVPRRNPFLDDPKIEAVPLDLAS